MTVCIEHDLLGDREISAEVYWGIHTLRVVENPRISSRKVSDAPQFVRNMMMVKKAAAQADGEPGVVKPEIAAAIGKACGEMLLKDRCLDQLSSDVYQGGAGTSINMNTNGVIANLVLEILGYEKGRCDIVNSVDHMNASQSTNGAHPTGFRLAVYYSVGELLEKLASLEDTFVAKADEFKDVLKIGRTQLQDAVLITAGWELQSFRVLLEEGTLNLDRTRALLLEAGLGIVAIDTDVNTPKNYAALTVKKLSKISGLDCKLTGDLIETTSDRGVYMMVHDTLKHTAVKLSKICNDLRLLSFDPRAGLKETNLPEMQTDSSIISAKVNPVIPEVVNRVYFKVIDNDTTITFAAEAGQSQLNITGPVIVQCIFKIISPLDDAVVNLTEKCVKDTTINHEICERYMSNSIGLVTYLSPYIGHSSGDLVGKVCAQTSKGVREVALERGFSNEVELDHILSPENLVDLHRGTQFGLK